MEYEVDGVKWSVDQLVQELTNRNDSNDLDDYPMDNDSEDEVDAPIVNEDPVDSDYTDSELSAEEPEEHDLERDAQKRKRPSGTSYRGRDGKSAWTGEPPEKRGRHQIRNIVTHLPGPKGVGKSAKTPISSWLLLFSKPILDKVLEHTNQEINARLASATVLHTFHKTTDEIELNAFLGLLYFIGVQKSSGLRLEELWSPRFGSPIYRATMPLKRFQFLCTCLRFDDRSTRRERKAQDSFAPIRDIWDLFITNCTALYTPFEYCTIDEQLLGFRGRCPFRIYMASKPDKYGIKILMMNDARTWYMVSAIPYTGRVKTQNKEPIPSYYVRTLSESIHHTGRNITVDNWFASIPLFDTMLSNYNITMLGTLRKNKREVPPSFLHKADPGTVKAGYSNKKTLVSYTPKKNKVVLILSTMHDSVEMDQDTSKPNLVVDYNRTKGGTDTFDQLCHEYSTARGTRRWPLRYFFGMLDQAAINAMVLFKLNMPFSKMTRREFLHELSWELIRPLVALRHDNKKIPRALKETIRGVLGVSELAQNNEALPLGRGRCHICPRSKDKKTSKYCSECHLHACELHSVTLVKCDDCK